MLLPQGLCICHFLLPEILLDIHRAGTSLPSGHYPSAIFLWASYLKSHTLFSESFPILHSCSIFFISLIIITTFTCFCLLIICLLQLECLLHMDRHFCLFHLVLCPWYSACYITETLYIFVEWMMVNPTPHLFFLIKKRWESIHPKFVWHLFNLILRNFCLIVWKNWRERYGMLYESVLIKATTKWLQLKIRLTSD